MVARRIAACVAVAACFVVLGGCAKQQAASKALTEKEKAYVREKLSGMVKPVELLSFNDGRSETGEKVLGLYDAIAALEPKVTHRRQKIGDAAASAAGVTQAPAVIIRQEGNERLRHLGLPSGYEFPTFIETIARLSRGEPDISPAGITRLAGLKVPVTFRIFVTPG